MKNNLAIIVSVLALTPLVVSAAPFTKDSFIATDVAATSTFAGNLEIGAILKVGAKVFANLIQNISGDLAIQGLNGSGVSVAAGSNETADGASLFLLPGGTSSHIVLKAGAAPSIDPTPQSVYISAGNRDSDGEDGGDVVLTAGNGFGGNGGDVILTIGDLAGPLSEAARIGRVVIDGGGASGDAAFDTSKIYQDSEKVYSFPDFSGTFGLLEAVQKWTGINTFSRGASATTTVNFGEMGDVSSKTCFNTKNTEGVDISFYFVGTQMVVENNPCL
jgi:hypothetical protein